MERYRVIERIGGSDNGETYKAVALYDISGNCPKGSSVAIKMFHHLHSPDQEMEVMKIVAEYDSTHNFPHFVETFEWTDPLLDTRTYTVTLCVPGINLNNWIRRNPDRTIEEICSICRQLFLVIAHIHSLDIVHNNIHKKNIHIDISEGYPQLHLIDFSMAQTRDHLVADEMKSRRLCRDGYDFDDSPAFCGAPQLTILQIKETFRTCGIVEELLSDSTRDDFTLKRLKQHSEGDAIAHYLYPRVRLYREIPDEKERRLLETMMGVSEIEPRKRWSALQAGKYLTDE